VDAGRGEPCRGADAWQVAEGGWKADGRARAGRGCGGAKFLGRWLLRRDLLFLVSRSGSCDVLPGAAVRGVSPVLLRTWIGPVPVKMQAALSPVVAKMRAWASPVLAQMWERICDRSAQCATWWLSLGADVGREESSRGADAGENESLPSAEVGRE
jgi:hypothetical protein